MINPYERWIQFHELVLGVNQPEAKINLESIIKGLKYRLAKQLSFKMLNNDTAAIRIVKINHDIKSKALILLLQYADSNVSDPQFSKLKHAKIRTVPKLEGEGIVVSAHVVISLIPNNENSHMFLLEEVPGLGRSRIDGFLHTEIKQSADYLGLNECIDTDSKKVKKFHPITEILGTSSQTLGSEEDEGMALQSIELIKFRTEEGGMDELGYYKEEVRSVKLKIEKSAADKVIDILKKVRKIASDEGYQSIKYRYKKQGLRQKTGTLNSDEVDIADVLLAKNELFDTKTGMPQCSEKFIKKLVDKMVGIVKESR